MFKRKKEQTVIKVLDADTLEEKDEFIYDEPSDTEIEVLDIKSYETPKKKEDEDEDMPKKKEPVKDEAFEEYKRLKAKGFNDEDIIKGLQDFDGAKAREEEKKLNKNRSFRVEDSEEEALKRQEKLQAQFDKQRLGDDV